MRVTSVSARAGRGHGDLGGLPQGIAIDTRRDGGKGDRTGAHLVGEAQRAAVAGGERRGLACRAAAPDGPHGVDDEARRQVEAVGDHGVTGRALADDPAGRLQALGPGGAVDGAVDATAAPQVAVRRVDDGVDPFGCDVALHCVEQRRHRVATRRCWTTRRRGPT